MTTATNFELTLEFAQTMTRAQYLSLPATCALGAHDFQHRAVIDGHVARLFPELVTLGRQVVLNWRRDPDFALEALKDICALSDRLVLTVWTWFTNAGMDEEILSCPAGERLDMVKWIHRYMVRRVLACFPQGQP